MEKFFAEFKKNLVYNKKTREVMLYLIFGGLTALISLVAYKIPLDILTDYASLGTEADIAIAQVISWVLAVSFAFFTNKYLVFTSAKSQNSVTEFLKFVSGRVISLMVETALILTMVKALSLSNFISKVVASVVTVIINYFWSKIAVFKEK